MESIWPRGRRWLLRRDLRPRDLIWRVSVPRLYRHRRCIRLYPGFRVSTLRNARRHDRELISTMSGIGCFHCFPLSVKHTVPFRACGMERLATRTATKTGKRISSRLRTSAMPISRYLARLEPSRNSGWERGLIYLSHKRRKIRGTSRRARLDRGWNREDLRTEEEGKEGGSRPIDDVATDIGNYFYTSATIIKLAGPIVMLSRGNDNCSRSYRYNVRLSIRRERKSERMENGTRDAKEATLSSG